MRAITLTRPIGDIFEYKGELLCVTRYYDLGNKVRCESCVLCKHQTPNYTCAEFRGKPENRDIFGVCSRLSRRDGANIVFVKHVPETIKINLTE